MILYAIRPIIDQDIPFLWEMLYESLFVSDGQEPFSREVIHEPNISKYIKDWGREGDLGFVAVDKNGQSIGAITVRYYNEDNKGYGYVGDDVPELNMAIVKEYRGEGIGYSLLKVLIEDLKKKRVKRLSLSVDPRNIAAVKLYQKFGFERVGKVETSITMVANI